MDGNQLSVLSEQVRTIYGAMEKMEKNLEKVSDGMLQLVEFRKEAEFLNQQTRQAIARIITLEERVRENEVSATSQKALNRIVGGFFSLAASASLGIGIYVAGSNSKFQEKVQDMDKQISILQATVRNPVTINTDRG